MDITEADAFQEYDTLKKAAFTYLSLKRGSSQPFGILKNHDGGWFPFPEEVEECCKRPGLRPSIKFKWPLYQHCKTLKHIAHKYHVNEKKLAKFIKSQRVYREV